MKYVGLTVSSDEKTNFPLPPPESESDDPTLEDSFSAMAIQDSEKNAEHDNVDAEEWWQREGKLSPI
jgi:hypothetical protein